MKPNSSILILAVLANSHAQTFYWNPFQQTGGAEAQRSFNWTENKDGTGDSPPSDKDDDFNSTTLNPAWKFIDRTNGDHVAYPFVPATYTFPGDGTIKLSGRGYDLSYSWWEVGAVYRSDITGNFDVSVKVTKHYGNYEWMKAGIVIWNDFTNPAAGGGFAVMATRDHGFKVDFNERWNLGDFNASDIYNDKTPQAPANGPYWLRAVKNGNTFSGFYKLSLASPWILIRSGTPLGTTAANSQIGLFVCAHDPANNATVNFDDFHGGGTIAANNLDLKFSGSPQSSSVAARLAGPLAAKSLDFKGYSGVFSFLNNTLTISGNADFATSPLSQGTGALDLVGTGVQILAASDTLPKIIHGASGTVQLGSPLISASVAQSGGKLDFNGFDISTLGNINVTNGNSASLIGLGGRNLTAKGNANFVGTPGDLLDLDPAATWTISAGDTLFADYSKIGKSTALGTIGVGSAACSNAGGNANWQFAGQSPLLLTRQTRDTVVQIGEKAVFSAHFTGPGAITLEWRRKGGLAILSTDTMLTIDAATLADNGSQFQCTATNANGSVTTAYATLKVTGVAARIEKEPQDLNLHTGAIAAFMVSASGARPISYKWFRVGDTTTASTDSSLNIASTIQSQNGSGYFVIVSNAFGADTSRVAKLILKSCDSLFSVTPESFSVDEGQPFSLAGTAGCADNYRWSVLSGPAPKILDPEVLSMSLTAPRISKDTVLAYQFEANYGGTPVAKQVTVRIKDAIPDPKFTLVEIPEWSGGSTLVLRPTLTNAAELKSAKYVPPLRYQWLISDSIIDTLQGGDSLVLVRPLENGTVVLQGCIDNGGMVACENMKMMVKVVTVFLDREKSAESDPFRIMDGIILWNAPSRFRVWNLRGRLLGVYTGLPGETTWLPESTQRALSNHNAIIEVR